MKLNRSRWIPLASRISLACLITLSYSHSTLGESIQWVQQLGLGSDDESYGVAADGLGNAYIAGRTGNNLAGPNTGLWDALLAKYDSAGALVWKRQFGTTSYDSFTSISGDTHGNFYASGWTDGGNFAGPSAGGWDTVLGKYDAAGNLLWARQYGGPRDEAALGVSADALGNVYVSGWTEGNLNGPNAGKEDAFVTKYDAAGNRLWTRQQGTSGDDESRGLATDGLGNVYVAGFTYGSLSAPNAGWSDPFVSKYDDAGNLLWSKQFGTNTYDKAFDVAADNQGNAYVTGYTYGDMDGPNAGNNDTFVTKFDPAGNILWTRQRGTSHWDDAYSVSTDGLGGIYISGPTDGDSFVIKYDASGNFIWNREFGADSLVVSWGVSSDGLGNVYSSGWTFGSLAAPNAGRRDAFLLKISDAPEPTSLILFALGGMLTFSLSRFGYIPNPRPKSRPALRAVGMCGRPGPC